MLKILIHELRLRIKATIGWGIGLILFGALYISVFPEVEEAMATIADIPIYEAMGMSLGSFEEYIGSVVLQFLPILLGVFGVMTGTRIFIGEEDDGTLELILAQPVSRIQIVLAKVISIGVSLFAILVIAGAGDAVILAGIKNSVDASVNPGELFAAVLAGWPISMAIASVSVFLSTFVPKRRIASMTATVLLIASYFGMTLTGMVSSLEKVRFLSIFTYYDTSLRAFTDGQSFGDVATLIGIIVVFVGGALLSFNHRNVTVGQWPWQRGRVA